MSDLEIKKIFSEAIPSFGEYSNINSTIQSDDNELSEMLMGGSDQGIGVDTLNIGYKKPKKIIVTENIELYKTMQSFNLKSLDSRKKIVETVKKAMRERLEELNNSIGLNYKKLNNYINAAPLPSIINTTGENTHKLWINALNNTVKNYENMYKKTQDTIQSLLDSYISNGIILKRGRMGDLQNIVSRTIGYNSIEDFAKELAKYDLPDGSKPKTIQSNRSKQQKLLEKFCNNLKNIYNTVIAEQQTRDKKTLDEYFELYENTLSSLDNTVQNGITPMSYKERTVSEVSTSEDDMVVDPKYLHFGGIKDENILKNAPSPAVTVKGKTSNAVIVVDLKNCILYEYSKKGEILSAYPVSSGTKAIPTPPGIYSIGWTENFPYKTAPANTMRRSAPYLFGDAGVVLYFVNSETGTKQPTGVMIHGCYKDEDVGGRLSGGCIRMFNEDIIGIVEKAKRNKGALVKMIYE